MIDSFEKQESLFGRSIFVKMTTTDCGIQLLIAGGDLSHIGAVAIADAKGKIEVTTFEGHRETEVARKYAAGLWEKYRVPIVVSAGIHYDNATHEEIIKIVNLTNKILEEILK